MSDTVQSKTVVLSAGSLSIGIRRALSRCILPLIYVSTFILLHSHWKIKPVFFILRDMIAKAQEGRPNEVWS